MKTVPMHTFLQIYPSLRESTLAWTETMRGRVSWLSAGAVGFTVLLLLVCAYVLSSAALRVALCW
mgnify:CR=1